MKCPYHNQEMHHHEASDKHACQFPKCAYAKGVFAKDVDPFAREKLISTGIIDDQMPSYNELVQWLPRLPLTWMPALFIKATEIATIRNVFANKQAMLKVCERSIDNASSRNYFRGEAVEAAQNSDET